MLGPSSPQGTPLPHPDLAWLNSTTDPKKIAIPGLQEATWASHHQWIQARLLSGASVLTVPHPPPATLYTDDPRPSLGSLGLPEARPWSQKLTVLGTEPHGLNPTAVQVQGPASTED